MIKATSNKRGRPTKNIKLKQKDTDDFVKELEKQGQGRPVIIQQKVDLPTDEIKQLLELVRGHLPDFGKTFESNQANPHNQSQTGGSNQQTDNISHAIVRALQSVGTKGLFKKIVNWAGMNYREEVVSKIQSEFGMR